MLGGGVDEVIIMPVVYPCGTVRVSSLGSFLSVGYFYKPSHPSITLSLRARHIQEYFKNKRVRNQRFIKPQQEKARCEYRRKKMRVTFRSKLLVGFGGLIPVESGYDN